MTAPDTARREAYARIIDPASFTFKDKLPEGASAFTDASIRHAYATADAILAKETEALAEALARVAITDPLLMFFKDITGLLWDGAVEIDAQDVQDIALKHGLIVKTEFDPETHTDHLGIGMEAGDEWFETAPSIKSALAGARP